LWLFEHAALDLGNGQGSDEKILVRLFAHPKKK
jgi:hypothetical protein